MDKLKYKIHSDNVIEMKDICSAIHYENYTPVSSSPASDVAHLFAKCSSKPCVQSEIARAQK